MCNTLYFLTFGIVAAAAAYEIGSTYKYSFETTASIDEECGAEPRDQLVGHGMKAKVYLTVVWKNSQKQLFKIEIIDPKLLISKKSSFDARSSGFEKFPSSPSYFLLEDGSISRFWDSSSEPYELRNVKRSVASFIQQKQQDQDTKETDVSGTCDVTYKVKGETVRKVKNNCLSSLHDKTLTQAYGVRSTTTYHLISIECKVKKEQGNFISKCTSTDFVKTFSNMWKKASLCISAKTALLFEGSSKHKDQFLDGDLESVIEKTTKQSGLVESEIGAIGTTAEHSSKDLLAAVGKYVDSLKAKNLAKIKSASAFNKLLPLFRSSIKEDILRVLKHKKFQPVMPQLLDLIAASSTADAHEAVLEFFSKAKDYDEHLERYFITLSVIPRPNEFILKSLVSLLEKGGLDAKIEATLISTLGALLRTYAGKHEIDDEKVVEEIRTYFEQQLRKCSSETCSLQYLRGLRNAAHVRSYPVLLEYTSKGGKVAFEAALAMRNIPAALSPEIQHKLLEVYHQVGQRQDRSSRSIVAEILLKRSPDADTIKSIIASLSNQSDPEFSTFITSKLLHLMSSDVKLKSMVQKLLKEKEVSHYYSLAQKGSSSIFTKHLLTSENINVTYGIEMEMLEGGLLKRSTFDVNFETPSGISNLLSVGMFAEGLASFAGGASEESGDESPTAGMELTLLGSSLRPYIFFSSTSELMGHAWSGTASEPTPALQGIFALTDEENLVVLSSGMIVRLQTRGILSTDLSASVQISLWNRNSQSQVKNAGALLVKSFARIESSHATTNGEFVLTGESAIDFNTDLEFLETPFKMCLQMNHPDITIRHDVHRSVKMAGTTFLLRKSKKRKRFIPSRSFALYPRNSEQCKAMNS